MASDLTGMFNMLNRVIAQNPLATGQGQSLMDQISAGGGGALANLMGAENPYGFMNEGGRKIAMERDLGGVDLQTEEGLAKAAEVLRRGGDQERALVLLQRRDELRRQKAEALALATAEATKEKAEQVEAAKRKWAAAQFRKAKDEEMAQAIEIGLVDGNKAFMKARGLGQEDNLRIGNSSQTVVDSKGNYFNVTRVTDKTTGATENRFAPLTPGGPEQPIGRVAPVSGTSGVNAVGRLEVDAQGRWNEDREEMVSGMTGLFETRGKVNRVMGLLEDTRTGGVRAQIANIKDFLDIGDTSDVRVVNNAMADFILAEIKRLGTNPTDTDLAFLNEALPNLRSGTDANVALFQQILDKLNTTIRAREYLLENPNASREDYVKNYKKLVEGTVELSPAAGALGSDARSYIPTGGQ